MQNQAKLKRHAALVDGMAATQGLDLEEQMMRGRLTFGELEDAVLRCTGCTSPDACTAHLAAQSGKTADMPSYCRNQSLFDELGKG